MFELRPYQKECLDKIQEAIRFGKRRMLVTIGTGGGKTVLFSQLPKLLHTKQTLVLAHRDELLTQAQDKLRKSGVTAEIEKADHIAPPNCPVVVGSVQSLKNGRLTKFNPNNFDLIVIDEAHRGTCPSYRNIVNHFNKSIVIGFTATPYRSDDADLLDVFNDGIVYSMDRDALTKQGFLAPIYTIQYPVSSFDPSSVYEAYVARGDNKKTVMFCKDVQHAKDVSNYFNSHDIKSACIHGEMPQEERTQTLKQFTTNGIKVLTSVSVISEGWDEPSVECVLIARRIDSAGFYNQATGRGVRLFEGKRFLKVIELTTRGYHLRSSSSSDSIFVKNTASSWSPPPQVEYQNSWLERATIGFLRFAFEVGVFILICSLCYKSCSYVWTNYVDHKPNAVKKISKPAAKMKVKRNVRKRSSHSHRRKIIHTRRSRNHRIQTSHAKPISFRYGVPRLVEINQPTRFQEERLWISFAVLSGQDCNPGYTRIV